jgi:uncharacterized protein
LSPPRILGPSPQAASNVPIVSYIVKVASRCNLNCSYCYVYNKGDDSYLSQPRVMDRATVSALLSRILTYSQEQNLRQVMFVFHGGEPLLAGREFFRYFVREAAAVFKDRVKPGYSMQTNGTLLDKDWFALFRELKITFGVSLDGPPEVNDRSRVTHSGAGSYSQVRSALQPVLRDSRLRRLFDGILTVIDLQADPVEIYRHWREIGISRCDFLLPDGTHDNPPSGISVSGTPYADWLIRLFDEWFERQDTKLSIRIFENIITLLFNPHGGMDSLGGVKNGLLVIETDGGIEPVDVLKICGPAFTKLGLSVHRNEIRDAYSSNMVQLYQQGGAGVCDTCLACPALAVCGGGYLPHRYSRLNGFSNPSVYCQDLMKLITHVRSRVLETLPAKLRKKLAMHPLAYEDLRRTSERVVNRGLLNGIGAEGTANPLKIWGGRRESNPQPSEPQSDALPS